MATGVGGTSLFEPFTTSSGPNRMDMMLAVFEECGTTDRPRRLLSIGDLRGYLTGVDRTRGHNNEVFRYRFLVMKGQVHGVDVSGMLLEGFYNVSSRTGEARLKPFPEPVLIHCGDITFASFEEEVPAAIKSIEETLAAQGYQLVNFGKRHTEFLRGADLCIGKITRIRDFDPNGYREMLVWTDASRRHFMCFADGETIPCGSKLVIQPI